MTGVDVIFKNRRAVFDRLTRYGFERNGDMYEYSAVLPSSGFVLRVRIDGAGGVFTRTVDPALGDEYTLHLTESAVGGFVGKVRAEYEKALTDIAEECFERYVFRSEQANACISYIRDKYGRELEYLWDRFDCAVWRRADNGKWFGVMMKAPAKKLGLCSDGACEIIDLRADAQKLCDGHDYIPGYHMNKKHWVTVVLDGRLPDARLFERIDESYISANKKGSK